MKKTLILISACILILSFSGCGETEDNGVVESTMPTISLNSSSQSSASSKVTKPTEKATAPTAKATEPTKATDSTKATKETDADEENKDIKTLDGTILSCDSVLELETADGNKYYFSMDFTADDDSSDIVSPGNTVTVKYTGDILGDDLGSAKDVVLISYGNLSESEEADGEDYE